MHHRSQRRERRGSANPRQVAWQCLQRWAQGRAYAETLLNQESQSLSTPDRAMAQAIVYGALRHWRWLDHLRFQLRPGELEDAAYWLILSGFSQLFLLKQPPHAAVCETVNLAPGRLKSLVNAILRQALRRADEFAQEWENLPLAVRYSMPDWLVERWINAFGAEETQKLLAWNIQPPPVYARLNPMQPMVPQESWQALDQAPGWFRIPSGLPMEELNSGHVYIADPSTRYSIELLAPQSGERILDACAAPGGKSVAILSATRGEATLVATDSAPKRLPLLESNLKRAGAPRVDVRRYDWTTPCPEEYRSSFDAVLLDVPCSNSGVLQRRVDVRWRLEPGEFKRMASIQTLLLEHACDAVRPGGRLVYSTCSIDREEDGDVVHAFLERHPEFCLQKDYLAMPHREEADGAYAALLLKRQRT